MRESIFAIAITAGLSVSAIGQPVVVLDTLAGGLCGQPAAAMGPSLGGTQVICIYNPDTVQQSIALAFKAFSPDDGILNGIEVSFYNGFDTLFGPPGASTRYEISEVADTFVALIVGQYNYLPIGYYGLPVSPDTVPYIGITFLPMGPEGTHLCIDSGSTWLLPEWMASPGPAPVFTGSKCYEVAGPLPNCCFFDFNCPGVRSTARWCQPVQFEFSDMFRPSLIKFAVEAGPGQIDWETGLYTFMPTEEDAGQSYDVMVRPYEDYCRDSSYLITNSDYDCYFTVHVGEDGPVSFVDGQQSRFVAVTDDTLRFTPLVEGECSGGTCSYSWYVDEGEPEPANIDLDNITGALSYYPAPGDTGTFALNMIVLTSCGADTATFQIYHHENYICGDCDHTGLVDIGDLTWLIAHLFLGGPCASPPGAAQVDCDPVIDIGDATRMIRHLFITFEDMCTGC